MKLNIIDQIKGNIEKKMKEISQMIDKEELSDAPSQAAISQLRARRQGLRDSLLIIEDTVETYSSRQ